MLGDGADMADRMTKAAEVVEAATGVFLRYGLARTTMGDIAAAARISRPALYLVFPSKDDVFAAVIRRMDETWHAELVAALERQPTAEAKLRHACGEWAAHGIGLVERYPDAKDLFDLRFAAVRDMYEHFELLVAGLLDEAAASSRLGATPRELARSLIYAMRGIRSSAVSTEDMTRLAELQVSVLVAALAPAATSTRRTRPRAAATGRARAAARRRAR
jgi:AcrR family transcriptional regulator